jgi:CRISPR-associated endoribonuclease Cas6
MLVTVYLKSLGDQTIDIDHLYANSAWVYSILSAGDAEYAKNLHDSKDIKGFCPSSIYVPNSTASKTSIPIKKDTICNIAVVMDSQEMVDKFILGLSNTQRHKIANAYFERVEVKIDQSNIKQNYHLCRMITPMVIADEQLGNQQFLHPNDEKFERLFFNNLNKKAGFILTEEELSQCRLMVVGDVKPRLNKIKHREIKGYKFNFKLKCPNILLNAGFSQGFGRFNAQGFGFAK